MGTFLQREMEKSDCVIDSPFAAVGMLLNEGVIGLYDSSWQRIL